MVSKFCGSCGEKIQTPTFKFCPKCGSALVDGQQEQHDTQTEAAYEQTAAAFEATTSPASGILKSWRLERILFVMILALFGVSLGFNIYLSEKHKVQITGLRQSIIEREEIAKENRLLKEQIQKLSENESLSKEEVSRLRRENDDLRARVQELTTINQSLESEDEPYLGVAVRDNLLGPPGARVVRVAPGSPAALVQEGNVRSRVYHQGLEGETDAQAGGQVDVITGIDGYRISGISQFNKRLSLYRPGDMIRLTVANMDGPKSDKVAGYEDVYVVLARKKE